MLFTIFIYHKCLLLIKYKKKFVLSKQQQEPLGDSHGYLQQSGQQDLLNPNMLNSYQEPDVSTIVSYGFHLFLDYQLFLF